MVLKNIFHFSLYILWLILFRTCVGTCRVDKGWKMKKMEDDHTCTCRLPLHASNFISLSFLLPFLITTNKQTLCSRIILQTNPSIYKKTTINKKVTNPFTQPYTPKTILLTFTSTAKATVYTPLFTMAIPHFLAIPFPIQGHINPLLQFSQVLVTYGCKITFLSSDENYRKLKSARDGAAMDPNIKFVSLPDGVDPEDDRKDQAKVISTTIKTMRVMLPKLIQDVNAFDTHNKISCIIVTKNMGWALEVGHHLGIKGSLFWPASATSLASFNSIQRLIDEGTIDCKTGKRNKHFFPVFFFLVTCCYIALRHVLSNFGDFSSLYEALQCLIFIDGLTLELILG